MRVIEFQQILLHYHLEIGIDGGVEIIAVHSRFDCPLQRQIIIEIAVFPAVDTD